jgi:hypothetical protein
VAALASRRLVFRVVRRRVVQNGFPQDLWIGKVPLRFDVEEAGLALRIASERSVGVGDGEVDVVSTSVTVGSVYSVDGDAFDGKVVA